MEMTRERLEAYRSEKDEIAELQCKLDHLGEGDSMIGNDTVFDYRKGYPVPQAVVGYDYDKHCRTEERYLNQIGKLRKNCEEVEKWIEDIPDSLTRRIFRMRYIEGMSQQKIAKKIHLHQSNVSRKIDDVLKNA